jgi:hypothetical protein
VTWSTGGVGSIGKQILGQLRENVEDIVDIFVKAYRAENPKIEGERHPPIGFSLNNPHFLIISALTITDEGVLTVSICFLILHKDR